MRPIAATEVTGPLSVLVTMSERPLAQEIVNALDQLRERTFRGFVRRL